MSPPISPASRRDKQPYAIAMVDAEPFTPAGLWENWKSPETVLRERTFTILTTQANPLVATLHDRMPVIIAEPDRDRRLTDADPADLIRPYTADEMRMWPVSRLLNSPKNDTPDLLDRVDEPGSEGDGAVERANEGDAKAEPENSE